MVFNKTESNFKNVCYKSKFAHKTFLALFNILTGGNFNF